MKKIKIISVFLSAAMLMTALSATAFAFSMDDFNALGQILAGNGTTSPSYDYDEPTGEVDTTSRSQSQIFNIIVETLKKILGDNPTSSQIAQAIQNSTYLSDLINRFFGNTNIKDEILKYFNAMEKATTEPATEAPTEEPTTEEPATVPVTQQPVTAAPYKPSTNITTPSVPVYQNTTSEETTTFEYIPPEQYYTEPLTEQVFNPNYDDVTESDGVTAKTVIGIVLLIASGGAAVFFAIKLKKNREKI